MDFLIDLAMLEWHIGEVFDGPGAHQVGDGVDDHPPVLEVRQGEHLVDGVPRPGLAEELLGREQDDVAALLLGAFEEPVAPRKHDKAIPAELETIVLKAMTKNPAVVGRGLYYSHLTVDPTDENRIYSIAMRLSMSIDGRLSRACPSRSS